MLVYDDEINDYFVPAANGSANAGISIAAGAIPRRTGQLLVSAATVSSSKGCCENPMFPHWGLLFPDFVAACTAQSCAHELPLCARHVSARSALRLHAGMHQFGCLFEKGDLLAKFMRNPI